MTLRRFAKRAVAAVATLGMGAGLGLASGATKADATTSTTNAITTVRTKCVGSEVVRCAVLKVNAATRSVYAYGSIRNAAKHSGLYVWVRQVRIYYYSNGWKYFSYSTPQKYSTYSHVAAKGLTASGTHVRRPFFAWAVVQYAYKGRWYVTTINTSSANLAP